MFIDRIRESANLDTCMVSAADKLHNSRSILEDHYLFGNAVFDRFRKSKDDTLWYYREILQAFRIAAARMSASDPRLTGFARLTDKFGRVLAELEGRTGKSAYEPCRA